MLTCLLFHRSGAEGSGVVNLVRMDAEHSTKKAVRQRSPCTDLEDGHGIQNQVSQDTDKVQMSNGFDDHKQLRILWQLRIQKA